MWSNKPGYGAIQKQMDTMDWLLAVGEECVGGQSQLDVSGKNHYPFGPRFDNNAVAQVLCSISCQPGKYIEVDTPDIGFHETQFPLPAPGYPVLPCKQYIGYLLLHDLLPDRANSSKVLDEFFKTHYGVYRIENRQADDDPNLDQRGRLYLAIGKLIWYEYDNGRSGKIADVRALFRPMPLFSEKTRKNVTDLLDDALVKGIITKAERDAAIRQIAVTIPSQDVECLLSEGRMKVSWYHSFVMADGRPVIRHYIEAHPVDPNDSLSACKIYEGSRENYFWIAPDLIKHIESNQWIFDPDLQKPTMEPQLVAEPSVQLTETACARLSQSHIAPLTHMRKLMREIGKAYEVLDEVSTPPCLRQSMQQDIQGLEVRLGKLFDEYFLARLPATLTSLDTGQACLEDFWPCFEEFGIPGGEGVLLQTYMHAYTALTSAMARLPAQARHQALTLFINVHSTAMRCHARMLLAGRSSPLLKCFNDAARLMISMLDMEAGY